MFQVDSFSRGVPIVPMILFLALNIYINAPQCLYWGDTGKENIFVMDEGCVICCLFKHWFISFLLRVECIFLLFSALSPSVVCGHGTIAM